MRRSSTRQSAGRAGSPDVGLQPERTVLAWVRTLLSLTICSVLFLRWLPAHGLWTLLPLATASLGGLAIYVGRRRTDQRAVRAIATEHADPPVVAILALTVLVIAVGLGAIAVI